MLYKGGRFLSADFFMMEEVRLFVEERLREDEVVVVVGEVPLILFDTPFLDMYAAYLASSTASGSYV